MDLKQTSPAIKSSLSSMPTVLSQFQPCWSVFVTWWGWMLASYILLGTDQMTASTRQMYATLFASSGIIQDKQPEQVDLGKENSKRNEEFGEA
ncbi:hypothetical protein N7451_004026 [Penicillium sp. IBT 35674x]|nr:hypothetical protein N7451_004026 [Penicillium sp. IBT 35674x]